MQQMSNGIDYYKSLRLSTEEVYEITKKIY